MPDLASAVDRRFLVEIEWQCRAALALADALDDALAQQDPAAARRTAAMLLQRLARLRALLWPEEGGERAAERRRLLGVPSMPWEGIDETLAAKADGLRVDSVARGRWRCRLVALERSVDLPAVLAEVDRLWGRTADLLVGG